MPVIEFHNSHEQVGSDGSLRPHQTPQPAVLS